MDLAKACEAEGADGVSLVNTFLGLAIDIKKKQPVFNNGYAGLSGPAIKPIALRMDKSGMQSSGYPCDGYGRHQHLAGCGGIYYGWRYGGADWYRNLHEAG